MAVKDVDNHCPKCSGCLLREADGTIKCINCGIRVEETQADTCRICGINKDETKRFHSKVRLCKRCYDRQWHRNKRKGRLMKEQTLNINQEPELNNEDRNASRFDAILQEIRALHRRKAADYGIDNGLGNFMEARKMGLEPWKGCLVRMSDKIARLYSFAKKGILQNESFRDSAIDLATYAILLVILWEDEVGHNEQNRSV